MESLYWRDFKERKQITTMREEKENVELNLCKELYKKFSEKPLLQVIQLLTHYAIQDIYAYADATEISLYLDDCYGFYRLWKVETQKRWEQTARRGKVDYKEMFKIAPLYFGTPLKINKQRGKFLREILMTIKWESLTWLLDPGDCADILCMYGDFVEKCGKGDYKISKESFAKAFSGINLNDLRGKKRRVSKDQEVFFKLFEKEAVDFFKKAEDEKPVGDKEYRARIDRLKEAASKKIDEQRKKKFDEQKNKLFKRGYLISPGVAPGLARYKLKGESSLKQVDKMFGLRKGGDISGTTADTVFAIEALLENFRVDELAGIDGGYYGVHGLRAVETLMQRAGYRDTKIKSIQKFMDDVQKIRNILCLLPVASMGYQGHHTILECAVTLTINDYIDYHLGLYTSLLPRAWFEEKTRYKKGEVFVKEKGSPIFEKAKRSIVEVLEKYENDKKNHWMVLSFESIDSEPVRCIVFDKDIAKDVELFKRLSWLSMNGPIWLDRMYGRNPKERYANENVLELSIWFWEDFGPVK